MHATLLDQRQAIWSAFTPVTKPARLVNEVDGRRITGRRIGLAAHAQAVTTRTPLAEIGRWRLRLEDADGRDKAVDSAGVDSAGSSALLSGA